MICMTITDNTTAIEESGKRFRAFWYVCRVYGSTVCSPVRRNTMNLHRNRSASYFYIISETLNWQIKRYILMKSWYQTHTNSHLSVATSVERQTEVRNIGI